MPAHCRIWSSREYRENWENRNLWKIGKIGRLENKYFGVGGGGIRNVCDTWKEEIMGNMQKIKKIETRTKFVKGKI